MEKMIGPVQGYYAAIFARELDGKFRASYKVCEVAPADYRSACPVRHARVEGLWKTAAQAFDGALTTKWCAGAVNNGYWLTVDLGGSVDVGRVILRHASAGGENAAWNTRDFSLQLIDAQGKATTVATVAGNTAGVTIHRFAPAAAEKVQLTITSPQTDTNTVAARLYEMEAYAR